MKSKTVKEMADKIIDISGACVGETIVASCIEELLISAIRLYTTDSKGVLKVATDEICEDALAKTWRCGQILIRYREELIEFAKCKNRSSLINTRIKNTINDELSFVTP
jgi:hypothetical protein